MAVPIALNGDRIEVGSARTLFQTRPVVPRYFYDVSRDGQRFLVNTADEPTGSTPLTLVVNWPALLRR